MNKLLLACLVAAALPLSAMAEQAPPPPPPSSSGEDDGMAKHFIHKMQRLEQELNLTNEQRTKVRAIFQEQKTKFRALHEETQNKLKGVLTPEQMKKLEELHPPHHHFMPPPPAGQQPPQPEPQP